ncbi:hypothetical protein Pmani_036292 [Petrolisthes manimaculis]|uniref:SH3 domain-containing protein n=1 Tax=Petrolisthes manimaculis TaxID=1843537 RepID=A0AAE1NKH4_9EUCA|nr:hypothetical protein Pmani_036292 [Petrolisthes manimaculis]
MEVEVVYPYEPQHEDELRLSVGDVIRSVNRQETGWYRGTTPTGASGVFPDNFVKVVDECLVRYTHQLASSPPPHASPPFHAPLLPTPLSQLSKSLIFSPRSLPISPRRLPSPTTPLPSPNAPFSSPNAPFSSLHVHSHLPTPPSLLSTSTPISHHPLPSPHATTHTHTHLLADQQVDI